jgi:hypothetical protein
MANHVSATDKVALSFCNNYKKYCTTTCKSSKIFYISTTIAFFLKNNFNIFLFLFDVFF